MLLLKQNWLRLRRGKKNVRETVLRELTQYIFITRYIQTQTLHNFHLPIVCRFAALKVLNIIRPDLPLHTYRTPYIVIQNQRK